MSQLAKTSLIEDYLLTPDKRNFIEKLIEGSQDHQFFKALKLLQEKSVEQFTTEDQAIFSRLEQDFGKPTKNPEVKIHPLLLRKYLLEIYNPKVDAQEKTRII